MKRTLQVLLAISLATMFLVSPVAAATSQGLEWGIVVGDQWNFDISTTDNGVVDMSEVIYFEVTGGIAVIPNILDNWLNIPKPTFDIEWANGTSLGWSALIFIFFAVITDSWVVPIGNYTLLGELYEDTIYNGTIYNVGNYWGYETDTILGQPIGVHVDYLKSDGFLAHWTVTTENGTLTMTRQGLGFDIMGFIQDNLLIVAAGGAILLIVLIVCIKRK
ncbi:hypothetical protein EU528_05860 [Candidatus Thorarchaeota archaeon]|nr:MAG: hypothetical protein EU528_05860 [Candidatus Thorarchaeota archaeon]